MDSNRLTLAADTDSVARARHAVGRFARDHGLDDQRVAEVELAVSEACTNVVIHAYRDRCRGALSVAMTAEDVDLVVHVGDDGLGMAPRTDSPGLGFGLPIIATLADGFAVERGEAGGTDVCMRFRRAPLAVA